MNPACLSIKFRPLITTFHKKSVCCLEIVPEISGLDNLDTVNWNDDELEYSIPLVYKVILKRRHTNGNDQKTSASTAANKLKTYHSCVDLLYTDSPLDSTNPQRDCSKNISDSFIFGKLLSDIQNFSTFLQKLDNNISVTALRHKCASELRLETKARNTSVVTQETNLTELHEVATEDCILVPKPTANSTVMTRLSMTPICSFNTNKLSDNQVNIQWDGSHQRYLTMFEPPVLPITAGTMTIELPNGLLHNIKVVEKGDDKLKSEKSTKKLKIISNLPVFTTQLTLAQCRITQFRILMNKEIMPLNEMLDKLIEKCVYLGIKTKSLDSDAPTCKLRSSWSGSNRVVYTIVSEG